ncbi:MAG: HMA2 domain-containing protein [Candidatus Magnetobacterium sp. LHC-1]
MDTQAHIVHQCEGRVRFKFPSLKGKKEVIEYVRSQLLDLDGVTTAEANHVTGSIIVKHATDLDRIISHAQDRGFSVVRATSNGNKDIAKTVPDTVGLVNTAIKKLSGGDLDLPRTSMATLILSGLIEIAVGKMVSPPWYVAFWYAYEIYNKNLVNKVSAN